MTPQLSLLIGYRNRRNNLLSFLRWFGKLPVNDYEAIIVEVDADASIEADISSFPNVHYEHIAHSGPFHMSRALNRALTLSNAPLAAPLDVDLVPFGDTLPRQLDFALRNPNIIFSGYRLMTPFPDIDKQYERQLIGQSSVSASEHQPYLLERILERQHYGVVPFLSTHRLREIGGWDERYIGWGAEDQEVLDRYLTEDRLLVRCESFIYLHQHHEFEKNWRESEYTRRNHSLYYMERKWPSLY